MSEMLSQEELDLLLGGLTAEGGEGEGGAKLSDEEIDSIGEIANISMGTAATTLFTLLNKKVQITTPKVSVTTLREIGESFVFPSVLIKVTYKSGIVGENFLVLKVEDVKVITDLMMGGDGTSVSGEITDMHLSAISEAMNQMIGSSSTSLSEMLGFAIDITPPEAFLETLSETDFTKFGITKDETVVQVSFDMEIDGLVKSNIMQILPYEFAKTMSDKMLSGNEVEPVNPVEEPTPLKPSQPEPAPAPQPTQAPPPAPEASRAAAPQPAPRPAAPRPQVQAQNVEFAHFDETQPGMYYNDIGLIENVPLEITVELGKAGKRINEILELGIGSVVELDKLVGEHLDVLANGRRIAKGEVVVVDENYGVRITEIIMSGKDKKDN